MDQPLILFTLLLRICFTSVPSICRIILFLMLCVNALELPQLCIGAKLDPWYGVKVLLLSCLFLACVHR